MMIFAFDVLKLSVHKIVKFAYRTIDADDNDNEDKAAAYMVLSIICTEQERYDEAIINASECIKFADEDHDIDLIEGYRDCWLKKEVGRFYEKKFFCWKKLKK